jgi:hypothetical protein
VAVEFVKKRPEVFGHEAIIKTRGQLNAGVAGR